MNTTKPTGIPAREPISDEQKIRALPWSIGFGVLASSVFGAWTVFGSTFLLYLQELGLPKEQIGFLLSLFPFCGILAPVVAPALARLGAKRVCLVTYAARNLVIALLLLLPLVLSAGGAAAGALYVSAVILGFAILRALAETSWYPWSQEFCPNSVRGKYGAVGLVSGTLASLVAVAVAGYLVEHGAGLGRFLWLQGAGCLAGLLGTAMLFRVPGGAPAAAKGVPLAHRADLRQAVGDRNFRCFLYGTAGSTMATGLLAFVPLMLVERAGLRPGVVIWLDGATMVGGLAACYLWGWMSDRFGSRTVLLPGLTLSLALPACWSAILLTGSATMIGIPLLVAIALVGGVATSAVSIGSGRQLLAGAVPPDQRVAYTAIFYAWSGLTGGLAPLVGGGLFAALATWRRWTGMTVDAYAVIFLLSGVATVLAWGFFYRTRPDGTTRTRELIRHVAGRVRQHVAWEKGPDAGPETKDEQ